MMSTPHPLLGISLNRRAAAIVRRMIDDAEVLGLDVIRYPNGATVVDAGVKSTGSLEAGRLFSEACMGGLGQVGFCELDFKDLRVPGVQVVTGHPALACVAAQLAGWPVQWEDSSGRHKGMGSGPARALRRQPEEALKQLAYRDCAEVAVLMLEGEELPPPDVAADIASECGILTKGVYLVVASVASLVGTVQVPARMVEAALHKMMALGLDVRAVLAGYGTCPLPPLSRGPLHAMGLANDAVLYGGRVWLTVEMPDAEVEAALDRIPSSASRDYGTPFLDLFERYGHDFYRMDPALFSVAEISLVNRLSGHTFRAGHVSAIMVRRTLGL